MKKWQKILLPAIAISFGACVSACASKQAVVVSAEGEEIVEVEPEVVETTEEKENWVKVYFETYIVPLLGGVSVTSIVSGVFAIIMTIVKNHQLDKKILASNKRSDEEYARAQAKYNEANEKYAQCEQFLKEANQIYQIVLTNENVSKETKSYVEDKMQYMVAVVDDNAKKVDKIDTVAKILTVLTELNLKVAKQSCELVKSGAIEDIAELTKLVQSLK